MYKSDTQNLYNCTVENYNTDALKKHLYIGPIYILNQKYKFPKSSIFSI